MSLHNNPAVSQVAPLRRAWHLKLVEEGGQSALTSFVPALQWSPRVAFADECVCVCCDFGQTWSGIRTAVTSPTCHMPHRGYARGRGIGRHKGGHKEEGPCACTHDWRSKEAGRSRVAAATWKCLTRRHPLTLMSTHTCARTLLACFLKYSPWAVESDPPQGHVVNTALTSNHHPCRSLLWPKPFLVLITYQWRSLFIKVLPVACWAEAFFEAASLLTLYISKQQLPSSVFGWKGLRCVYVHGNISGHLGIFILLQREELVCFNLNNGFKACRL